MLQHGLSNVKSFISHSKRVYYSRRSRGYQYTNNLLQITLLVNRHEQNVVLPTVNNVALTVLHAMAMNNILKIKFSQSC